MITVVGERELECSHYGGALPQQNCGRAKRCIETYYTVVRNVWIDSSYAIDFEVISNGVHGHRFVQLRRNFELIPAFLENIMHDISI